MRKQMDKWRERARVLKRETYTLYLAYRDPRVPWYAKLFVAFIIGYALSPVDLIPDFIPVLGYLDDVILLPLGIRLALKMIPEPVLEECRVQAAEMFAAERPRSWLGGVAIVLIWLVVLLVLFLYLRGLFLSE